MFIIVAFEGSRKIAMLHNPDLIFDLDHVEIRIPPGEIFFQGKIDELKSLLAAHQNDAEIQLSKLMNMNFLQWFKTYHKT